MEQDLPIAEWIDAAAALKVMLAEIACQPAIGIDTEANSFFAYREQICLIQISSQEKDYLLDPLADFDFSALGEIFADPKMVKVFHDGEYDIGLMKKDFAFAFANIFDTRIAVATLGSKTPGLASVLQERFGVSLDKKFQRSNWGHRPLSEGQKKYAQLDTHFLCQLHEQLKQELEKAGRYHIAESEFRRLERLNPKEQTFDPDGFVRIKGARELDLQDLQILKSLYLLREQLAKESNQPPFRILMNDALIQLAKLRPNNEKNLTKIKGLSWKVVRKMGSEVLQTIEEAKAKGPLQKLPIGKKNHGSRLTANEQDLFEKLRMWRKSRAEREKIDASHMLRKEILMELAKATPTSRKELKRIRGIEPWHIDSYGDEILKIIMEYTSKR